jgi:hypothetical protein
LFISRQNRKYKAQTYLIPIGVLSYTQKVLNLIPVLKFHPEIQYRDEPVRQYRYNIPLAEFISKRIPAVNHILNICRYHPGGMLPVPPEVPSQIDTVKIRQ